MYVIARIALFECNSKIGWTPQVHAAHVVLRKLTHIPRSHKHARCSIPRQQPQRAQVKRLQDYKRKQELL